MRRRLVVKYSDRAAIPVMRIRLGLCSLVYAFRTVTREYVQYTSSATDGASQRDLTKRLPGCRKASGSDHHHPFPTELQRQLTASLNSTAKTSCAVVGWVSEEAPGCHEQSRRGVAVEVAVGASWLPAKSCSRYRSYAARAGAGC